MSGQPYKNPLDVAKFRNEYLANLALEVKNNDLNLQANKVYIRTGAPSQPTDTRTTSEKLADLYRLRIDIRSKLGEIMSGDNAQKVVDGLDENEARFLAQQIETIVADLKPKFALGVPADVFNPYLQKYMRKYLETQGVDYGLQQESGRQLLANQQTIMNTIVSAQDIRDIKDSLELLGLQNTLLGKKIEGNLKETLNAIDTSIEAFNIISQTNNPILKEEILKDINLLVNELPTRNQIIDLRNKLEIAQERRDATSVEMILQRLNELTEYDKTLNDEVALLRQKILMAQSSRPPESLKTDVTGETPPPRSVDYAGFKYSYILPTDLFGVKKDSSYEKDLKGYIEAIAIIDSGLFQRLGTTKSAVSGFNKPELINWLQTNDSEIKQSWSQIPVAVAEPVVSSSPARITAKGLKKTKSIHGKGLSSKVDYSAGIGAEPDYVPFGKFLINRKKLVDGVIMIKRCGGQFLPDMKTKRVSPNLTVVFKKIAGGNLPSFSELEKLDDDERDYLKFIANKSNLSSKLDVPSPKKDKNEQLINQFEVMRGQMVSGNDSKDLFRKFKQVLVEMLDRNLIPRGQAKDILLEMSKYEI
jgi:hypothetical protein